MRAIVFDTSSIISIVMNDLIDVLKDLKTDFRGEFYITPSVKNELVDKPLRTKNYSLEAMMVQKLIDESYLKILKPKKSTNQIETIANHLFKVNGKDVQILQAGEIEALMLALELNAEAFVIDERTTRVLIEESDNLKDLLERKLHTKVIVNKDNLKVISKMAKNIKIIRSTELAFVAYEKGLLERYISSKYNKKDQVDALLWGMRTRGCSISVDEIEKAKKMI